MRLTLQRLLPIIAALTLTWILTGAAFADSPGLSLNVPAVTFQVNLTVSGQTVPGSVVTIGQSVVTADATGAFTVKVPLKEGVNSLVAEAATPQGQRLAWSGTVTLDTLPPVVRSLLPSVTNTRYFRLYGKSESGANVVVNGKAVTVDADGSFETTVDFQTNSTIQIVATDAVGNQTTVQQAVSLADTVPWLWFYPTVGIAQKAAPNTVVTVLSDPKRPEIKAGADGAWWLVIPLRVGANGIWLRFTPPSAEPYVHYYEVFQPLSIDLPRRTNYPELSVQGKVLRGWSATVNGSPLTTSDDGAFTFETSLLKGDVNKLQVVVTSPQSNKYSLDLRVNQVDDASVIKDGIWQFRTVNWKEGSIIFTAGKAPVVVGADGKAAVDIAAKPGLNEVNISYLMPSGYSATYRYRFTYTPPIAARTVKMRLGGTEAEVNGAIQTLQVPPQRFGDSTFVPLRFLAESLGATVSWDGETHTATFVLGSRTVSVTVGNAEAKVDGVVRAMAAPPRIENDRVLVPLRFIGESLGATVKWDAATEGIEVTLP